MIYVLGWIALGLLSRLIDPDTTNVFIDDKKSEIGGVIASIISGPIAFIGALINRI